VKNSLLTNWIGLARGGVGEGAGAGVEAARWWVPHSCCHCRRSTCTHTHREREREREKQSVTNDVIARRPRQMLFLWADSTRAVHLLISERAFASMGFSPLALFGSKLSARKWINHRCLPRLIDSFAKSLSAKSRRNWVRPFRSLWKGKINEQQGLILIPSYSSVSWNALKYNTTTKIENESGKFLIDVSQKSDAHFFSLTQFIPSC